MSLPTVKWPGSATAPDYASKPSTDLDQAIESECPKSELKPLGSISLNRIIQKKRKLHFKLMIIGESGLGKSTAIKRLLHGLTTASCINETDPNASESKTLEIKEHGPFLLNSDDDKQDILLKIVDSPGYGDNIDAQKDFDLIEEYMQSQWSSYYSDIKTAGSFDAVEHDSLVNACLYFISPHRLKEVDIEFMKRISRSVAIVPVIAKADTMTTEETIQFRKHVHQVLAEQNINVYSWTDCTTGKVDIEIEKRTTESHPFPPFTLICAKDCTSRNYLWGDCRLDNEGHSDFLLLKSLLLEKHLLAMKDQAKQTWKCKFYDQRQAELAAQDQKSARDWSWLLRMTLLRSMPAMALLMAGLVLIFLLWNAGTLALWALGKGAVSVCARAAVMAPVELERARDAEAELPSVPPPDAKAVISAGPTLVTYGVFTVALLIATGAAAVRWVSPTRKSP